MHILRSIPAPVPARDAFDAALEKGKKKKKEGETERKHRKRKNGRGKKRAAALGIGIWEKCQEKCTYAARMGIHEDPHDKTRAYRSVVSSFFSFFFLSWEMRRMKCSASQLKASRRLMRDLLSNMYLLPDT